VVPDRQGGGYRCTLKERLMFAGEQDWLLLRSGADDLYDYLLSAELYGTATPARGGGEALRLTVGNVLLSLRRLRAVRWPAGQQETLDGLERNILGLRQRWRANWQRKAQREFVARLQLWQDYLHEVSSEGGRHRTEYAFKVRWRAVLECLRPELGTGQLEEPRQRLEGLERRLEALSVAADFVWEADLAPAFPSEPFWFLYRSLR